jgi:hypothetical protein
LLDRLHAQAVNKCIFLIIFSSFISLWFFNWTCFETAHFKLYVFLLSKFDTSILYFGKIKIHTI